MEDNPFEDDGYDGQGNNPPVLYPVDRGGFGEAFDEIGDIGEVQEEVQEEYVPPPQPLPPQQTPQQQQFDATNYVAANKFAENAVKAQKLRFQQQQKEQEKLEVETDKLKKDDIYRKIVKYHSQFEGVLGNKPRVKATSSYDVLKEELVRIEQALNGSEAADMIRVAIPWVTQNIWEPFARRFLKLNTTGLSKVVALQTEEFRDISVHLAIKYEGLLAPVSGPEAQLIMKLLYFTQVVHNANENRIPLDSKFTSPSDQKFNDI
jgi:hypothetical protein